MKNRLSLVSVLGLLVALPVFAEVLFEDNFQGTFPGTKWFTNDPPARQQFKIVSPAGFNGSNVLQPYNEATPTPDLRPGARTTTTLGSNYQVDLDLYWAWGPRAYIMFRQGELNGTINSACLWRSNNNLHYREVGFNSDGTIAATTNSVDSFGSYTNTRAHWQINAMGKQVALIVTSLDPGSEGNLLGSWNITQLAAAAGKTISVYGGNYGFGIASGDVKLTQTVLLDNLRITATRGTVISIK